LHRQGIARVIVDDRQRMAASPAGGKVPLEIHLPQLVGLFTLEALVRPRMFARPLLELPMPPQNLGNRARRRYHQLASPGQNVGDLAAAPSVVATLANSQDLRLNCRCRSVGTVMWTPRAIGKPVTAFRHIAGNPFVAFG